MNIFIILFFGVLVVMGISISMMLNSLSKQGDERRDFIINKAIKGTFIILVGILMISVFESAYISLVKDTSVKGINPFILLSITSIVFALELLFTKKKFGD
ncbi:hypothetical protein [Faecalimicrobium sp. JNUCC 81]